MTNPTNSLHELCNDAENSGVKIAEHGEENGPTGPYFMCPSPGDRSSSGSEQALQTRSQSSLGSASGSESSAPVPTDAGGRTDVSGGRADESTSASRQSPAGRNASSRARESSPDRWQAGAGLGRVQQDGQLRVYKRRAKTGSADAGAGPVSPGSRRQSFGHDDVPRLRSSVAKSSLAPRATAAENPNPASTAHAADSGALHGEGNMP